MNWLHQGSPDMTPPVKRNYSSDLRAAHARETRRAIVAAAARLFVEEGYVRTTVDDIAQAAGVSRKTVFTAVGGKLALLKFALDWAVVGDDEPVALAQRPRVEALKHQTDPDALIRGWTRMAAEIASRVSGLSSALAVAAGTDLEARELWERSQAQRHQGARAFVTALAGLGGLRAGLSVDDAADIAWLHSDPSVYYRLVTQRRWSRRRFEDWLVRTMLLQL